MAQIFNKSRDSSATKESLLLLNYNTELQSEGRMTDPSSLAILPEPNEKPHNGDQQHHDTPDDLARAEAFLLQL